MMKELNTILGIETKMSTAFHPQTDGQTERMNQELDKSGVRTILKILYRLQTERLARVASISTVCNKQQDTFNN